MNHWNEPLGRIMDSMILRDRPILMNHRFERQLNRFFFHHLNIYFMKIISIYIYIDTHFPYRPIYEPYIFLTDRPIFVTDLKIHG